MPPSWSMRKLWGQGREWGGGGGNIARSTVTETRRPALRCPARSRRRGPIPPTHPTHTPPHTHARTHHSTITCSSLMRMPFRMSRLALRSAGEPLPSTGRFGVAAQAPAGAPGTTPGPRVALCSMSRPTAPRLALPPAPAPNASSNAPDLCQGGGAVGRVMAQCGVSVIPSSGVRRRACVQR